MSAPDRHQVILHPPHPNMTSEERDFFLKTIYERSGGLTANTVDLKGLEASVAELNTLVGIDTRNNNTVQKQLNLKANAVDLGTIASQDANNVAITGGSITDTSILSSDIKVEAGNTSNYINIGGSLDVNITTAGNSAGVETTLISYTMPVETLSQNKMYLEVTAFGTIAANANNKEIKLKIGSTTLLTTGSIAANSGSWEIKSRIIRENQNGQKCTTSIISSNALIIDSSAYINASEDLSTQLDIFCTGNGVAANDVVQEGLIIKWYKF